MKLLVGSVNKYRKPPARKAPQRFDVSRLNGDIVDDQGKLRTKRTFQDKIAQTLKSKWKDEGLAEEEWNLLKAILYVKQQNLPWESRLQETQIGMWRVHLNLSHCLSRGISST